jgi:hypothetical protein
MQAKNEILEELRLLSAVVSGISRETPYGEPAGYFDGFPARMAYMVDRAGFGADSAPEGPGELPSFLKKDKSLTFNVPEGYFEGFAQGLLDRIKAGRTGDGFIEDGFGGEEIKALTGAISAGVESVVEELTRLSPVLSGISRKAPYQAPEGYFEELSPMSPVLFSLLAEVREKPLYAVPEGYFAGLAGEVLSKIGSEQVSLSGEDAYTQVVINEPARVVAFDRGIRQRASVRQRALWKYSAAAVVAGLIFTIGWLRFHTSAGSHHAPVDVAGNLVRVSDQDLQSYLEDQNDQNATLTEPMNSTATLDITDSDVKSLLGDVPDGELKSYMEEHGGPNDIATN